MSTLSEALGERSGFLLEPPHLSHLLNHHRCSSSAAVVGGRKKVAVNCREMKGEREKRKGVRRQARSSAE